MKLRIEKTTDAKLPNYAHHGDAGLDLYSAEDCRLKPMEIRAIATGIKAEIPEGYAGLVWDKSGIALHGMHAMAGVIDSTYRGEIKCVMMNIGKADFDIKKNTKIAQMLIQPVVHAEIEAVDKVNDTKRGLNGFGSTGRH